MSNISGPYQVYAAITEQEKCYRSYTILRSSPFLHNFPSLQSVVDSLSSLPPDCKARVDQLFSDQKIWLESLEKWILEIEENDQSRFKAAVSTLQNQTCDSDEIMILDADLVHVEALAMTLGIERPRRLEAVQRRGLEILKCLKLENINTDEVTNKFNGVVNAENMYSATYALYDLAKESMRQRQNTESYYTSIEDRIFKTQKVLKIVEKTDRDAIITISGLCELASKMIKYDPEHKTNDLAKKLGAHVKAARGRLAAYEGWGLTDLNKFGGDLIESMEDLTLYYEHKARLTTILIIEANVCFTDFENRMRQVELAHFNSLETLNAKGYESVKRSFNAEGDGDFVAKLKASIAHCEELTVDKSTFDVRATFSRETGKCPWDVVLRNMSVLIAWIFSRKGALQIFCRGMPALIRNLLTTKNDFKKVIAEVVGLTVQCGRLLIQGVTDVGAFLGPAFSADPAGVAIRGIFAELVNFRGCEDNPEPDAEEFKKLLTQVISILKLQLFDDSIIPSDREYMRKKLLEKMKTPDPAFLISISDCKTIGSLHPTDDHCTWHLSDAVMAVARVQHAHDCGIIKLLYMCAPDIPHRGPVTAFKSYRAEGRDPLPGLAEVYLTNKRLDDFEPHVLSEMAALIQADTWCRAFTHRPSEIETDFIKSSMPHMWPAPSVLTKWLDTVTIPFTPDQMKRLGVLDIQQWTAGGMDIRRVLALVGLLAQIQVKGDFHPHDLLTDPLANIWDLLSVVLKPLGKKSQ